MDCPKCKYFRQGGCAVAPNYWQIWYEFRQQPRIRDLLSPVLMPCKEFDQAEPVTVTLTLLPSQWNEIRRRHDDDRIGAWAEFHTQLRPQIDPPEPETKTEEPTPTPDDIPF